MEKPYCGIVLFGPPGVGKGAQAGLMSKKYGLVQLSTGDAIREEIKKGSPLGKRVQDAVAKGLFADDETVLGIVMSKIDAPEMRGGFIMDGFPRNTRQAEMFDKLLAERKRKVTHALFIVAPDEVVLKRLGGRLVCSKCGATYNEDVKPPEKAGICDACKGPVARRKDDDPKTQRDRLEQYRVQTTPLIDYYGRSGVLRKVNGDQSIDAVSAEIARAIDEGR
jgi:adenylate kinase